MTVMRNARSVLIGIVLGIIGIIVTYSFIDSNNTEFVKSITTKEIQASYRATCKITASNGGTSTGVLLDTGYILASGHGVDLNGDWIVQPNERNIKLEFLEDSKIVSYKGRVIIIGNDYSIIEPEKSMCSDISITLNVPAIGTPVYTLGFPLNRGIHITKGHQSSLALDSELERTSISAYKGNSGGGVFLDENRTTGVVNRVAIDSIATSFNILIPIPLEKRMLFVIAQGRVVFPHFVSDWSEYVSCKYIYSEIEQKGLGFVFINQENESPIFPNSIYRMTIQLFILLLLLFWIRKDLFGK